MSKDGPDFPRAENLVTLNRAATIARLVGGVFHEVNNSLQVIGGLAELLHDTPGLPAAVAEGIQRIQEQNAKAAGAIAEAMAFARQKSELRGRVNLRDLVSAAVSMRSFAVGRARLTMTFTPPSSGRVDVSGCANLLQLAILNLIINAEQSLAGQHGGAIRVEMEAAEQWVIVRVSDNGPGVDAAIANHLFEPFTTTRSHDESSGLGLAVARHIAEQHGGTLTLESSGLGACFALRLPAI